MTTGQTLCSRPKREKGHALSQTPVHGKAFVETTVHNPGLDSYSGSLRPGTRQRRVSTSERNVAGCRLGQPAWMGGPRRASCPGDSDLAPDGGEDHATWEWPGIAAGCRRCRRRDEITLEGNTAEGIGRPRSPSWTQVTTKIRGMKRSGALLVKGFTPAYAVGE